MEFLDANVFLRYLTRDDPVKAEHCYDLFQRLKSKAIRAFTSESVLAEVVYVLSSPSLYRQSREQVRTLMSPLISLPGLKIQNRRAFLRALDIFAGARLDFEDALSLAHMERMQIKTIISYDRDFDSFKGIKRREP